MESTAAQQVAGYSNRISSPAEEAGNPRTVIGGRPRLAVRDRTDVLPVDTTLMSQGADARTDPGYVFL